MRLLCASLLAGLCAACLAGDVSASPPDRNGSIVYASRLVPAPASGIVELGLGSRVERRSLTARTGIGGLLPIESPDRRLIATVNNGQLVVSNRDGSNRRRLGRAGPPSWSPDSRELAFSDWERYQTIAIVDVATGERRSLGYGSNPSWSPDGSLLAFVDPQGLGLIDTDGSNRRIVWKEHMPGWYQHEAPAWSPDGRRVALSATDPELFVGPAHAPGIVVFELATGAAFSKRESARHASWSPSGAEVTYVRTRGRKSTKELVLLDVEHRTRRILATLPFSPNCEGDYALGSLALGADFSPDGKRIAFASAVRQHGRCRVTVATVAPAGGNMRLVHTEPPGSGAARLRSDDVEAAGPRWLRDGSGVWLALEQRTPEPELYSRSEDGTNVRRLTHTPAVVEHDPRFSPDGRRLAFVRGWRGQDGVIWIADADGGHGRALGRGNYPTWSPDGERIAFTRRDALQVVPSAGGPAGEILAAPVAMPAWSPDGRSIAFVRARGAAERRFEEHSDGIATVDLRTKHVRYVRRDGFFPRWSPDGRVLAYTMWLLAPAPNVMGDEFPRLRLMTRGGAPVARRPAVDCYDAAWSPDGSRLVGRGLAEIDVSGVDAAGDRLRQGALPDPLGIDGDEADLDWQPRPR